MSFELMMLAAASVWGFLQLVAASRKRTVRPYMGREPARYRDASAQAHPRAHLP